MNEEVLNLKGKELYNHLVKNKDFYIQQKKLNKTKSAPFNFNTIGLKTVKAMNSSYEDKLETGIIKRDIVANTYNWMDSHFDVHVGNTFKKSIKERSDKIFHLHDHDFKVIAKVGEIEKIEEKKVDWADLGINKQGETVVLMVTSEIMKGYNEKIYSQYLTQKIDQHSVGMQYVKIDLALNDEEYKEENKVWKNYIDKIGNPEKAIEMGFFWAVSEAKLIEASAVLAGSNELTPTITNEPPSKGTQPEKSESAEKGSHPQFTDEDEEIEFFKQLSK